jgi:hypothetical protein
MHEDELKSGTGPGIRMNNDLKKMMAMMFTGVLEGERFKWHFDFTTTSEKHEIYELKEKIMAQMSDYKVFFLKTNNKFAAPTEIYSGKGGYGTDDVIIAIQINYVSYRRFFDCPEKYQKYW